MRKSGAAVSADHDQVMLALFELVNQRRRRLTIEEPPAERGARGQRDTLQKLVEVAPGVVFNQTK